MTKYGRLGFASRGKQCLSGLIPRWVNGAGKHEIALSDYDQYLVTATDQRAAVEAGRASAESFRTIVDARLPSRFHCYFRFELKIGEFEPAHTKQALVRRPRMGDKLPTTKFGTARQFDTDPLRNRAWDADHFYVLVVEEGLQTRLVKTKDGTWRIPLKGNLPYKKTPSKACGNIYVHTIAFRWKGSGKPAAVKAGARWRHFIPTPWRSSVSPVPTQKMREPLPRGLSNRRWSEGRAAH